jgi:hypothetical protein
MLFLIIDRARWCETIIALARVIRASASSTSTGQRYTSFHLLKSSISQRDMFEDTNEQVTLKDSNDISITTNTETDQMQRYQEKPWHDEPSNSLSGMQNNGLLELCNAAIKSQVESETAQSSRTESKIDRLQVKSKLLSLFEQQCVILSVSSSSTNLSPTEIANKNAGYRDHLNALCQLKELEESIAAGESSLKIKDSKKKSTYFEKKEAKKFRIIDDDNNESTYNSHLKTFRKDQSSKQESGELFNFEIRRAKKGRGIIRSHHDIDEGTELDEIMHSSRKTSKQMFTEQNHLGSLIHAIEEIDGPNYGRKIYDKEDRNDDRQINILKKNKIAHIDKQSNLDQPTSVTKRDKPSKVSRIKRPVVGSFFL